jgi:hypothetical protein
VTARGGTGEFLKRIFGICQTRPPQNPASWQLLNHEIVIELKRVPELAAPGRAIRRLEGGRLPERILVRRGLKANGW